MTIDQIIALSASIAGCLSALAAFWTVRQMVKQRQESYKPDLALKDTYFVAVPHPVVGGPLPLWWMAGTQADLSRMMNGGLMSVPLRNVGLGTAKQITVTWSLETEDLTREVNRLAEKAGTEARVTYKDGTMSLVSETLKAYTSLWNNEKVRKIDYLLPASVEVEAFQLVLPMAYSMLSTLLIYLGSNEKNKGSRVVVPTLGVTFDYFDVGGVEHQARYDIECSVMMVSETQINGYLGSERRTQKPGSGWF